MNDDTPTRELKAGDHVRITDPDPIDGRPRISDRDALIGQTGVLFHNRLFSEHGKLADGNGDYWVRLDDGMPGYASSINGGPMLEVCVAPNGFELID